MMLSLFSSRWRRVASFSFLTIFTLTALYGYYQRPFLSQKPAIPPEPPSSDEPATERPPPAQPQIIYKDTADRPLSNRPFIPIEETFPLAAAATSPADLPPIPAWNRPPATHVAEKTPLFIGFTRNWPLLQQTVVSFLTAGWPPEDIYVVENTGVMDANQRGQLSPQNPFYLDHHRLTHLLGVHVLTTPSLQTFAQLQNLFLYEALQHGWPQYFWAHMDILVQSAEDAEPYRSFYLKCVDVLRQTVAHSPSPSLSHPGPGHPSWALRYFAYDWVTLMNTAAMVTLGGWDTMISYYTADCDTYGRMNMSGMSTDTHNAGPVYDTGESFDDLALLYRQGDSRGSQTWTDIQQAAHNMAHVKNTGGERNRWQVRQMGGQGDPYYRDMDGFNEALEINVQAGIAVYEAKWRIEGCALASHGLALEDQWLVAGTA